MVAVPEFVQKYVDPGVFRVFRRTTVIGLLIVAYTFYQMDEETQAGLKELAAEMAANFKEDPIGYGHYVATEILPRSKLFTFAPLLIAMKYMAHKFEQRAIKATEELEAQKATEVKKAKKAKKTS